MRRAVIYILEGQKRKKEKLTDIDIRVTIFLLPGRVAIGTSVKEQSMRMIGMEGNWQVLYTNAYFSVAPCLLE